MRQRGLGWHAACDDMGWRRGLGDPAFTRPAGVFGATRDDHAELGRNDIKPFADILADHMTFGPTGAGDVRLQ